MKKKKSKNWRLQFKELEKDIKSLKKDLKIRKELLRSFKKRKSLRKKK